MTFGRTVLIVKDKDSGPMATNFRPITCLPLMWKLFTGILGEMLYQHLEERELLPKEQKGCQNNARGTKDQLLIDKMIIKNCKRRLIGLGMAWIDFRKAFDMVPHSWIIKCMSMFGVADNIISVLSKSMEYWRTELSSGGERIGEVNIRRGIFQGDSLSPLLFVMSLIPLSLVLRKVKAGYNLGSGNGTVNHLLFMDDLKVYGKNENQVDTLVQTVRVVSSDMGMEFGISKCAMLVMKKGKIVSCEGITLPNDKRIRALSDDNKAYKYLGVLEVDDIRHSEMKDGIRKEYFRRLRKILKSKLNGGNVIKAINSRAVSLVRYGAGIIDWAKDELRQIDRKTRKLLTIYHALHPQADVDRLYMARADGGRGLIGVEDCVALEVTSLIKYINKSMETTLKAVLRENIWSVEETTVDKSMMNEERKRKLLDKPLHGQFFGSTQDRDEKSWEWIKKGKLKKETEGLLMAAQDQALRTNSIKCRVDKQKVSPSCRMCGEREETVAHVTAECKMLAQKYYKNWRHDKVAQIIHWRLCEKLGFYRGEKWYNHLPEPVLESENSKILWDFKIQTDLPIEANKPDIVFLDKIIRKCYIIDVACPFDTRVSAKEKEKIDKYQDLKREITRIWKCAEVVVVPIIIGALGTLPKGLRKWLNVIDMGEELDLLQRTCILGSARILRRVLGMPS